MALRDYNRDGKITSVEQLLYTTHYNMQREYWVSKTKLEKLSLEEFIEHAADNPSLSKGATVDELEAAFKKLDLDKDGMFSFDDFWKGKQEDDIHWRLNNKKFEEIDSNNDLMITRQEVVSYLTQNNPDSTDLEIQAMADEYSINGEESLGGDEMWNIFKGKMAQAEADVREEERFWLEFNIDWFVYDLDRNTRVNYSEVINLGLPMQEALDVFDYLGLDTVTDDVHR